MTSLIDLTAFDERESTEIGVCCTCSSTRRQLTIDDTGVFLNFSIRKIKRINRYANELERQVKPLADLLIDFIQFYFFKNEFPPDPVTPGVAGGGGTRTEITCHSFNR